MEGRSDVRLVTPGMRRMLLAASLLVVSVGVPLFILTERTDTYFAWTIKSSLTAAFLGAAYWSACALELLASRERTWARARIAVPAVLVFTSLTLLVTLLHLDKFHFNRPEAITRIGTWVWLAVYAFVPPVLLALLLRQLRAPGGDPPRQRPLPAWTRGLLAFNAAVMIGLGLALLVVPLLAALLWPWALTELTGRAIGAWLVGLGVGAAQAFRENDLGRVRVIMISAVVFCALQFVALARYPGEVDWSNPRAWLYLLFLLNFLLVGLYGWRASRQNAQQAAPAAA